MTLSDAQEAQLWQVVGIAEKLSTFVISDYCCDFCPYCGVTRQGMPDFSDHGTDCLLVELRAALKGLDHAE